MKVVFTISLSILLGLFISSTYELRLSGMNPFLINVMVFLNLLLLCPIAYLIFSEQQRHLKILEIVILVLSIGVAVFVTTYRTNTPIKEAKNLYESDDFHSKYQPNCHFYLEEYEAAHPDIDYFPNLAQSDSTAFQIEDWTMEEIKTILRDLKAFEDKYKCSSSIEKYSLDNFFKSSYFKAEISTIFYPQSLSHKTIIVYWDRGHTIISHGFEPEI